MPQVELKYSHDVTLDDRAIFESIENTIAKMDSGAGICKSRAYPTDKYLHSHVFIDIALLKKPHRDDDFMKSCLESIDNAVKPFIPDDCYYAIHLDFSSPYYLTLKKTPGSSDQVGG